MFRSAFLLVGWLWFTPLGSALAQTPPVSFPTPSSHSILDNDLFAYALKSSASPGTWFDNAVRDFLEESLAMGRELSNTKRHPLSREISLQFSFQPTAGGYYLTATNSGDNRAQVPYITTLVYFAPANPELDIEALTLIGAAVAKPDVQGQTQEFLLAKTVGQESRWLANKLRYTYLDAQGVVRSSATVETSDSGKLVPLRSTGVVFRNAPVERVRVDLVDS